MKPWSSTFDSSRLKFSQRTWRTFISQICISRSWTNFSVCTGTMNLTCWVDFPLSQESLLLIPIKSLERLSGEGWNSDDDSRQANVHRHDTRRLPNYTEPFEGHTLIELPPKWKHALIMPVVMLMLIICSEDTDRDRDLGWPTTPTEW